MPLNNMMEDTIIKVIIIHLVSLFIFFFFFFLKSLRKRIFWLWFWILKSILLTELFLKNFVLLKELRRNQGKQKEVLFFILWNFQILKNKKKKKMQNVDPFVRKYLNFPQYNFLTISFIFRKSNYFHVMKKILKMEQDTLWF